MDAVNTESVWEALGGDPSLLPRVSEVVRGGALEARLPVRELARACVGACALAAAELGARRAGLAEVPRVRVDDGAVATAFVSERHLLVDGRQPVTFAPLSRFWRTADGWVRTHANYPHHRARLLDALGLPGDAPVETVAAAPGSPRPAAPSEGCGTRCRRCPSTAVPPTGRARPGCGVRTRRAGLESWGVRKRTYGRNAVRPVVFRGLP